MLTTVNELARINNCLQSLLILSTSPDKPVLLIVHGGAGLPDRALVQKYNRELADYYTVVCWDQRGSGFSPSKEPLCIDLLLSDLKAVVEYLREKYHQERIYVAGHSWGSYLGLRFVSAYPEYVKYYIGTGQMISAYKGEIDRYLAVREQALAKNNKRVLALLDRFGEPDGYKYKRNDSAAKGFVLLKIIGNPGYVSKKNDYSLGEYLLLYLKYYGLKIPGILKGAVKSYIALNIEMDSKDSISCITELKVPVLLISGEEDMICPVPAARRWFENLSAPKKDFAIIKNASHMVNFEQPAEWNRLLINLLD